MAENWLTNGNMIVNTDGNGITISNGTTSEYFKLETTVASGQAALYLITPSKIWRIYNDDNDANKLKFRNDTNEVVRMYLTTAGVLYIDGTYETFTPELPVAEGYEWAILAKAETDKPHKPANKKIDDLTEEEIDMYSHDIAKIAIMNTKAIDYLMEIQKGLVAKVDDLQTQIDDLKKQIK